MNCLIIYIYFFVLIDAVCFSLAFALQLNPRALFGGFGFSLSFLKSSNFILQTTSSSPITSYNLQEEEKKIKEKKSPILFPLRKVEFLVCVFSMEEVELCVCSCFSQSLCNPSSFLSKFWPELGILSNQSIFDYKSITQKHRPRYASVHISYNNILSFFNWWFSCIYFLVVFWVAPDQNLIRHGLH